MINRDTNPKQQPDQQLRYALNVNPHRELGGLPIEEGNSIFTPYEGTLVGKAVFNGIKILFTHVFEGDDIIYRLEGQVLKTLFRGNLGFDENVNVQCKIVPDSRKNLIAYFTDFKNSMKYININKPQTNVDDMQYFVSSKTPIDIAQVNVSESGGAIPAGVWFAFVGLVDEDDIETNFITSKPIYITDGDVDFNKYDGADGGTITSKSITLNVTGIDTKFKYLRIVMCSRQAGVYQNGRQFDYRITNSSEFFTFTGAETFVERTIEQTIVPKVYYDRVKTLAYNDNTLYLGNCVEGKDIGAQAYINNSTVIPILDTVTFNRLANSHKDANTLYIKTGFFNDEVVALYAVFNLKNGNKSAAYHIPGRQALTINGVNETMNWTQFQAANPSLYNALGGDEHKSISNNGPLYTTLDTNLLETSYPFERMSFWQNNTEFYPNTEDWDIKDVNGAIIGSLKNQKVRHHKIPSNRSMYAFYQNVPNKSDNGYVVGIQVNLNLPQSIKNQILSVEIYYARRDGNNARIQSQGTFIFADVDDLVNTTKYKNPTVNTVLVLGPLYKTRGILRYSSFDHKYLQPNSSSSNYLKIDTIITGVNNSVVFANAGERRLFSDGRLDTCGTTAPSASAGIKKITRTAYLPTNAEVSIPDFPVPLADNVQCEDTLLIQLSNEFSTVEAENFFEPNNINIPPTTIRIPIVTIYTYKEDVYKSFFQQELIFAGRGTSLNFINVFGGDCFINHYSYRSTNAPYRVFNYISKSLYSFPVQSSSNIWFRQAGDGIAGMYFPRTPVAEFLERVNVPDFIKYNNDYSTLNNLDVPVVFDPDFIERDNHFTRIHKTLPQGVERGTLRRLAQEDFIDLPTHRGALTGIGTINGNLIPHMERSTFKTYGTQQLNTDEDSIVVKTVDIFNVTPEELLETDLGYGGTQHINTILNTPHGAFWVDAVAGKIFMLSNGLEEISGYGLFNFFEDALRSKILETVINAGGNLNVDRIGSWYGIHSWYDQRYRRIFMTVLDYAFAEPSKYKGDYNPSTNYTIGDFITIDGKIYSVAFYPDEVPVGAIQLNNPSVFAIEVPFVSPAFVPRHFTAAYYPEKKGWVFYSFTPYNAISDEHHMYTVPMGNSNIWIHGTGFSRFYHNYYPYIVEMVLQHKSMTNLQFLAIDFQNFNGEPVAPTSIMAFNTRQNSGEVIIDTSKTFGNIRFVNNYWMFNKLRDCILFRQLPMFEGKTTTDLQLLNAANINMNKKSFTKAFLNDTYHVVRFTYQPTEQKDVTLFGILTQPVKSNRL